ncbi:hypothetical protein TthSNM11_10400 [Thermus thermophilus]|uniref:hypothetical protein n=1 Tax=Thermus thermophilus TaxID=274 RepID=UPI001FCD2D90|nr:hypothetical protein [Thermus thermophilus]BDG18837.1 hypothetical protein TthSNM11_10400 [Thermus thermophilus]
MNGENVAFKAGDVVFTVPRSMFRADVNGVVQVGEHQVPAKVIYAAWAVGVDEGVKAGVVLGAGLSLVLVLGVLLLLRAVNAWRERRRWTPLDRIGG